MVLFEVNIPRVALTPFERYAPRAVDVQAITLRLSPERMEVKARDVQVAQDRGMFKRVESPKRPALDFRRHFAASALAEQLLEALVAKAPYHRGSVTPDVTPVKAAATDHSVAR